MAIKVDIVTPERSIRGEVDMITLPGTSGQMGILRGHAPLLSTLDIGEIVLHQGGNRVHCRGGGVVEVRPDKVTILADFAESSSEIDEARAEAARARAEELLAGNPRPTSARSSRRVAAQHAAAEDRAAAPGAPACRGPELRGRTQVTGRSARPLVDWRRTRNKALTAVREPHIDVRLSFFSCRNWTFQPASVPISAIQSSMPARIEKPA